MAKIQIKNSFITSSAQITISSSLVRFSDSIRAKGITGSFSGSFAGSNLFVQGGNSFGTTALLGTNDNQPLVLETNASEKLRITAAGNVGIGTSNPIAKLHTVGSNGSTDYVYQQWSYTSNVGVYDLILKQTVTSNVVRYNFSMNNASTAYNDVLVLDRGCVGIGTSFPLSKLDVRGTLYVNYGSNGTGYIQTNGTDSDLQITTATNLTTLLNTGTSGAMAFGAGNSERMRILSGGNVGIGSSSPNAALDVNGSIHLNGNLRDVWNDNIWNVAQYPYNNSTSPTYYMGFQVETATRTFYISNKNNDGSATDPNGGIMFRTGATPTNRMLISYTGNVGIGTTSPTCALQVDGTIRSKSSEIFGFGSSDSVSLRASSAVNVLGFYTSNAEKMRLAADGNLGIGTTNPTTKLHVYGNGAGFEFGVNSPNCYIETIDRASVGKDLNTGYYTRGSGSFTWNNGSYTERMRISGTGNVGIGTTSPASRLQLGNLSSTQTSVPETLSLGGTYSNSAGANIKLRVYEDSNGGAIGGMSVSAGQMEINTWSAGKIAFYRGTTQSAIIDANGNLGIGTSSPPTMLQVVGTGVASVGTINIRGSQAHLGLTTAGGTFKGWYGYFNSSTHGSDLDLNIKTGYEGSSNIRIGANGDANHVFISGNGNVGIGTTSPVAKLHITGSSTAAVFQGNVGIGTTSFTYSTSNRGLLELYGATDSLIALRNSNNPFYIQKYSTAAYFNNTDNGPLIIYTNNTERMRLDAGGNLGIGTSSPSIKLAVDGEASFGDGSKLTLIGLDINSQATPNFIKIRTKIPFASGAADFTVNIKGFRYGGVESTSLMICWHYYLSTFYNPTISSAGSYAPTVKLSAEDWDSSGTPKVCIVLVGPGYWPKLYVESMYSSNYNDAYADGWDWVDADATGTGNNLAILSYKSNFGNSFVMTSGGSVGIGSSSPNYRLDVNGGIASGGVLVALYSGNYNRLYEPAGNPGIYLGNNSDPANYYDNSTHYFRNRGGSSNYAIINSSGNLGIGTSTVDAPLHIYRASNPWIRLNGGGNFAYIRFDDGTSNGYLFKNTSSDTTNGALAGAMYTYTDSGKAFQHIHSGTPLFTILSGGNVGIGSTAPAYKLDVNGTFRSTGDLWTNGNIIINRAGAYLYINGTNSDSEIVWQANGSNRWAAGMNVGDATENFNVYNYTTATTNFTILKANGNVGIGSATPAYKLDVNGGVNINGILSVAGVAVLNEVSNANDIYANIRVIRNRSSTLNDGMYINYDSTGTTAAHLRFYANAQNERMRIQANDGHVGIGTSIAAGRLDVYDSTDAGNIAFVRNASTGTSAYSAIVLRRNGDANGIVLFTNSSNRTTDGGAGNSTIRTDNGNLLLGAGGSSQHILTTAGSVGIGTTTVESGCLVTFKASNTARLSITDGSTRAHLWPTGGNFYFSTETASDIVIITNATERMRITSAGNVGIGTTSPAQKLHVVGAVYGTTYGQFGTSVASGTNSSYAVFGSNSTVVGVKINIDSNVNRNDLVVSGSTGNVGIGTNQVLSKLNAYASGSNLSVFRVDGGNGTLFEVTDQLSGSLFSVNDVSGLPLLEVFSNNRVVAGKYGTNALVVSGSSVGIGTSRPSYRLQVSGSFAATTKSFVIKHPDPAKSDKQLVHGVTEGPEHSVFVRGKLENNNIIQLPDYWQHLVDVDTISVTLTPNKYYQQLYVKNVTDKSIEVGTETDKPINCYYYVVGERKDIPKLITEI